MKNRGFHFVAKYSTSDMVEESSAHVQEKENEKESKEGIFRQKDLEKDRAYLAAIVNSSFDAIYSKDMEGIITSWNKAAKYMYGYKPSEIIGTSVTRLIPLEKYDEYIYIMKQISEGKKVEPHETERITKQRQRIQVSVTVSPVFNMKGEIIGASAIARDISQIKKLEERYRFLSEASKILSSSLDYEKTLTQIATIAVPKIADWCTISIVEGTIYKTIVIAHKDPKKISWAKRLQKKYPQNLENQHHGLAKVLRTGIPEFYPIIDKSIIESSVNSSEQLELLEKIGITSAMIVPLKIKDSIIGAITFVSAESRMHFAHEDLLIAQELAQRASVAIENAFLYEEAQRAVKIRENFLSFASHELRTPITSAKLYLQFLKNQLKNISPLQEKFFTRMDLQLDNLALVVSNLLDVSKLQTGALELKKEKIRLVPYLQEIMDLLRMHNTMHSFILQTDTQSEVVVDKERISQVILNLLTNAVKYSPHGGEIQVKMKKKKNMVVISVKDVGIGIPKIYKKKIFDKFFRIDEDVSRTYPGLGMGLFISAEIVKRHGGRIWVKSQEGKGSTFSFSLPTQASVS